MLFFFFLHLYNSFKLNGTCMVGVVKCYNNKYSSFEEDYIYNYTQKQNEA